MKKYIIEFDTDNAQVIEKFRKDLAENQISIVSFGIISKVYELEVEE